MPDTPIDIPSRPQEKPETTFTAVILAGAREENDLLRKQEKESLKAFIKVGGTPMIDYVLKAALRSGYIDDIYVCIDAEDEIEKKAPLLAELRKEKKVRIIPTEQGPSASAEKAVKDINIAKPVLITTADHPLLTRAILKEFLQKSLRTKADATLGVIPTDIITNAYPKNKRTRLKFREGSYTGCNLFTFLTPSARELTGHWQVMEDMRKTPFQMATHLGPGILTQYLLGLLTLDKALEKLSKKTSINVKAVRMHQAEAGIDVDTPEDLNLVKEIIQNY